MSAFDRMLQEAKKHAQAQVAKTGVGLDKSGLSEASQKLFVPLAEKYHVDLTKQSPKFWLLVKDVCEAKGDKVDEKWKEMMLTETCQGFYGEQQGSDTGRLYMQFYAVDLRECVDKVKVDAYAAPWVFHTCSVKFEYPELYELEDKWKAAEDAKLTKKE